MPAPTRSRFVDRRWLACLVAGCVVAACSSATTVQEAPPQDAPTGAAAPAYPACATDGHCAGHGQVCVAGTCAQCRDAEQCGALGPCGRCEAGTCVKTEGCCERDDDCPAGGRCRAGKCK